MRHVAIPVGAGGAFSIARVDADGVGCQRLFVGVSSPIPTADENADVAAAARLLVVACGMPDGIVGAITALRAHLARTS